MLGLQPTLDATYVRGVPNTSTDPGTTGGATTHQHTTSAHDHTISHTHATATDAGPTGTASYTATSTQDMDLTTHTHATNTIAATTDNSGTASPSSGNTSNDPDNLAVIWIESNGTPTGIPNGALAMYNSTSLPGSWAIYTNSQNRFLKGAATSGDGGGTAGSATHSHTGEGSHTHTSDHVHPNGTTANSAGRNNSHAAGSGGAGDVHSHSYTVSSNNFGTSDAATLNTSTDNHEPTYQKLAVIENQTGGASLPAGTIAVWRGTLANIPEDWVLADGTNGTPDLLGDFTKGALDTSELGNTGGGTAHTHTGSNHAPTWASTVHTHTVNITGAPSVLRGTGTSGTARANATHTHTVTSGAAGTVTIGNAAPNLASATHLPPYEEVAFIMLKTFDQGAYHFFNNANSTDVGSELTANQDTPVTLGATGDAFRLRMILRVNGVQLGASGKNFKLQFAEQSGSCDTGFSGETYADVGSGTAIAYSTANSPSDGDNLTANAEDPTYTGTINNQDYEEANNFTNSVSAIAAGENGKWDFSLIDNVATANTAYCFRIVSSAGTLFTTNGGSYLVVPQITMASGVVPPTLTFSVSDNDIFFGTLSSSASQWADNTADGSTTAAVAHTLAASTNATNGYTITVQGATLTSTGTPGDTITAMGTEATLTTGQEEFGLRITASGGNGAVNTDYDNTPANSYFYGANATTTDVIATDADGDDISTTYSLYYAANIATTTEAHTDYQATLNYVATGNF